MCVGVCVLCSGYWGALCVVGVCCGDVCVLCVVGVCALCVVCGVCLGV